MDKISGYIGRKTLGLTSHLMDLAAFFYRLLQISVTPPGKGRKLIKWVTVEQIYFTGVQALYVIVPISLIIGSMIIIQFTRLSGKYDMGKVIVLLLVRELGPMITAMVVILRSASAVTIEISYMKVLNEIESIEMSGVDPMVIISLPRLIGITTAMIGLFIVFDIVSIFGGYATAWAITDMPMGNFLWQVGKAMEVSDIAVGMLKAVSFGIAITVVSLCYGFSTKREVTEIPQVTSRSEVECFFFCLVISIFISLIFYF